ncbi:MULTISPECIES: hypothetical protein [unclassified Streptomyces]|uniref:hypothetical protein n=1 Tax=unclassified Streptomyces TaxID=2593676 RepID=UPI002E2FEDB2|nr:MULTISPECIES: hypothetical protein [unclassified Streptomyces]WUC69302.1 hypothetical protein OG861_32490 [Streptomyces sp. NBC_00539]
MLDEAAPQVIGGGDGVVEEGHSSAPFRWLGKSRPFVREVMRSTYSSLSKDESARISSGVRVQSVMSPISRAPRRASSRDGKAARPRPET